MSQSELSVLEEQVEIAYANTADASRESIAELDKLLIKLPQQELVLQHIFAKGAYMRYITLPKDTLLTSKIHKTQHISLVLTGECTITKPDGTHEYVVAPHIFITEPNTKRVIFVHKDTTWVTFHVTDKTDIDEIEKDLISEDYL